MLSGRVLIVRNCVSFYSLLGCGFRSLGLGALSCWGQVKPRSEQVSPAELVLLRAQGRCVARAGRLSGAGLVSGQGCCAGFAACWTGAGLLSRPGRSGRPGNAGAGLVSLAGFVAGRDSAVGRVVAVAASGRGAGLFSVTGRVVPGPDSRLAAAEELGETPGTGRAAGLEVATRARLIAFTGFAPCAGTA